MPPFGPQLFDRTTMLNSNSGSTRCRRSRVSSARTCSGTGSVPGTAAPARPSLNWATVPLNDRLRWHRQTTGRARKQSSGFSQNPGPNWTGWPALCCSSWIGKHSGTPRQRRGKSGSVCRGDEASRSLDKSDALPVAQQHRRADCRRPARPDFRFPPDPASQAARAWTLAVSSPKSSQNAA